MNIAVKPTSALVVSLDDDLDIRLFRLAHVSPNAHR